MRSARVGAGGEPVEDFPEPLARDRVEPAQPEPPAHAVDPLGDSRAMLVAGDPRAAADLGEQPIHRGIEGVALGGRPFDPIEVMLCCGGGRGVARGVKPGAQEAERRLEAVASHQRAIEAQLPRHVREQSELGRRDAARAQALEGVPLAVDEHRRGVEPGIRLRGDGRCRRGPPPAGQRRREGGTEGVSV